MSKANVHRKKKRHVLSSIAAPNATTPMAKQNIDLVLASVTHLPMAYWQPLFFFKGANDKELLRLSNGLFPLTTKPGKTHPVISLKPMPDNSGYKVSPCSTKRPWYAKTSRYVRKGCCLTPTGHPMDKNSYVIEHIEFPIPASLATKLRFLGKIPVECIVEISSNRKKD